MIEREMGYSGTRVNEVTGAGYGWRGQSPNCSQLMGLALLPQLGGVGAAAAAWGGMPGGHYSYTG